MLPSSLIANSIRPGVHSKSSTEIKEITENLSGWVRDPTARKRYVEAFKNSDFDAMLNYYKRNYRALKKTS